LVDISFRSAVPLDPNASDREGDTIGVMEKKRTNSGPFMESTGKHGI
jgi:hypothetical protein